MKSIIYNNLHSSMDRFEEQQMLKLSKRNYHLHSSMDRFEVKKQEWQQLK